MTFSLSLHCLKMSILCTVRHCLRSVGIHSSSCSYALFQTETTNNFDDLLLAFLVKKTLSNFGVLLKATTTWGGKLYPLELTPNEKREKNKNRSACLCRCTKTSEWGNAVLISCLNGISYHKTDNIIRQLSDKS